MQANRFQTIDALRGVAALFVVLFHLGGSALPKLASPATTALTSWGWTGVELFFVISGFVIPHVLLRSGYRWSEAGRFLLKRFVRIWPPSAVLLGLTVLQFLGIQRFVHAGGEWTFTAGQLLANFTYLVPFTGDRWLNGVFWTLSVEFQYYLLLAIVFPLIERSRAAILVTLALCAAGLLIPGGEGYFPRYAVYFAMGGLTLLRVRGSIGVMPFLAGLGALTLAAALGHAWLPAAIGGAGALLIAFAYLTARPLLFLGKISYSLYLTHILAASMAEFVYVRLVAPSSVLAKLAGQGFCLVVAILGAWLFYLVVERFFLAASAALSAPPPAAHPDAYAVPGAP
ncbi:MULTISPECIES: acyltransferase family protein [Sphingomonas]|uniref:acyltransferase family protein n=1 Tax=Sphingomonas TaxID=13687 RepID=UPI000DEEEDD4|nr:MULTISPECIES: acyltransferase [Sphingomonas]